MFETIGLRASRQSVRTSPGITVVIDEPGAAGWVVGTETQFATAGCDCGGTYVPCAAHSKSAPTSPQVENAVITGIELSRACSTPYPMADLRRQATDALEAVTDFRASELVAQRLQAITPAQITLGAFGETQALALLLNSVSAVAGGSAGVVWLTPYDAALLLGSHSIFVASNGQLSTSVGLHDVVVLPGWDGLINGTPAIAWTPPGALHLTEVEAIEHFDATANKNSVTAERNLALLLPILCAKAVQVDRTQP